LYRCVLISAQVPDILEKRTPYRPDHIKLAQGLQEEGVIVAFGAYNPPTGAAFIFSAENKQEVVESFVKKDPYMSAGLVTKYDIKEWAVMSAPGRSKL
jgi:uncharacterized protein